MRTFLRGKGKYSSQLTVDRPQKKTKTVGKHSLKTCRAKGTGTFTAQRGLAHLRDEVRRMCLSTGLKTTGINVFTEYLQLWVKKQEVIMLNYKEIFFLIPAIFMFFSTGVCEPADDEKADIPVTSVRVTSVEVKGNRRLADEEILSLIKTEKGRDFNQAVLTEDLKTLYRQGWFADVGIDTRDEEGGKKVLFIVKEKPLLKQILFEGNYHLNSKYLKKQLSSGLNEPLNGQKLKKDLNKLKEVYESRGFPYAEVEEKTEIEESNNEAVCRLRIKEVPRVRLRKIRLSGNSSFPDKQILKLLRTKKKGFLRKGVFKKKVFKKDMDRIGEFYRDRGYLDAKVNGSFEYEEKAIFVKIVIDEGRRYLTGKVSLAGNVVFSRDELFEKLEMLTGTVFTYSSLYRDVAAIRDAYLEKGYLDVSVRPDVALTKDKDEVDVVYKITENKLSFVGEIRLKGNLKTKDKVIRRELKISPGERFDGTKIKRSIQRLYNLGFFEYVTYDTEATAEPGVKDIIFEVKEARTGQFAFGAGYSSVDGLVGFLEIEQKNFDVAGFPTFTGAGQDLKLRSEFGTRRKNH